MKSAHQLTAGFLLSLALLTACGSPAPSAAPLANPTQTTVTTLTSAPSQPPTTTPAPTTTTAAPPVLTPTPTTAPTSVPASDPAPTTTSTTSMPTTTTSIPTTTTTTTTSAGPLSFDSLKFTTLDTVEPQSGTPIGFSALGSGAVNVVATIDGQIAAEANSLPWNGTVNTAGLSSGNHTLMVKAFSADGSWISRKLTVGVFYQHVTPSTSGNFPIHVVFAPGTTDDVKSAVNWAVQRWQQVITTDLPGYSGDGAPGTYTLNAGECGSAAPLTLPADGLLLYAGSQAIDGAGNTVAQSGPCITNGNRVYAGELIFDTADLQGSAGHLPQVALHEIAHSLGIGTMWDSRGLLNQNNPNDLRYIGTNALREYHSIGGTNSTIPVESTGGVGTAGGHWRDTTFQSELMTSYYETGLNPMSRMTLGALQDLGYTVDMTQADPYTIPSGMQDQSLNESAFDLKIDPARQRRLP